MTIDINNLFLLFYLIKKIKINNFITNKYFFLCLNNV